MKRTEIFINFNGNCEEAIKFYADVFGTEIKGLMRFSEMPAGAMSIPEDYRNKIMYASLEIFGMRMMFSDMPAGMSFQAGNHISPTLISDEKETLMSVFEKLKQNGEVVMEPQKTFWSEYYGMVNDQFGIQWQVSHEGIKSVAIED